MDNLEMIVNRSELLQAFKTLQIAAREKNPPELVIQAEPGLLVMRVGESKSSIPGRGSISGRACIGGVLVKILPKMMPNTPEIAIRQEGSRIAFGKIQIGCRWEIPQADEFDLPIHADWLEVLCLGRKSSMREIEVSGYKQQYEAVTQERDRRILRAFEVLAPFGLSKEELANLVEQAVTRLCQDKSGIQAGN